jgi:hypothetical protein
MTRAEAMNRHPAKGSDSMEKLLILLELTKVANEVQAAIDRDDLDEAPFNRGVKQGMAFGIDRAIKAIQGMEVTE